MGVGDEAVSFVRLPPFAGRVISQLEYSHEYRHRQLGKHVSTGVDSRETSGVTSGAIVHAEKVTSKEVRWHWDVTKTLFISHLGACGRTDLKQ